MIDAVDVALITVLQNDATLAPMVPGGVHRDFEPESTTGGRCVIVTLQSEIPTFEHGGTAHLQTRYQVKVVDQATTKTAAQTALDRIDAILTAPFTIVGQTYMISERVERFAYLERVGSATWQHVGCDYTVWSDPT